MSGSPINGAVRFIFDIGGVLIRHDDALLYERIAARCEPCEGSPLSLSRALQDPLLGTGHLSVRALHERLVASFGFSGGFPEFLELWSSHFSEIPEMLPIVDRLSRHHRVALFSNTNDAHWSFISRQFPVLAYAQASYLSYELGLTKPDPASFQRVLEKEGCAARECFFVDDKAENVAAARAAGMIAHGFTSPSNFEAALSDYGI